jgi:hypothetical protein
MGCRHVLGLALALALVGACKAELGSADVDGGTSKQPDARNNGVADAAPDSPTMLGPWGTPAVVPGADSALDEDDVTLSSTRLELYFRRLDPGPDSNLYVMTRATQSAPWSAPTALPLLNSSVSEESPRLSQDDLTLYFGRNGDIYKTTRASTTSPWTAPTAVTSLNTGAYEKWAAVCSSGYVIVSRAVTNNGQDLFEGDINTGATNAITQFNTANNEQGSLLTSDCLHVYFQSNRAGNFDIYTASRLTMQSAWSNPTMLTDFNTATYSEEDPWISPDAKTFVFASNANGNKDVYISTR